MTTAARPPDPPEDVIAAALSHQHIALWRNNAWFHDAVTTLGKLLVPMVQGIADQAEAADQEREQIVANLMRLPGPVSLDDLRRQP